MTDDLKYLLACVQQHADKFPVPEHMQSLADRVRVQYSGVNPGAEIAAFWQKNQQEARKRWPS